MFKSGAINRFLSGLESRWSLLILVVGAMSSIAFPAWAVRAANLFAEYSPASWVIAGFLGFIIFAVGYLLIAIARAKLVRARYDHSLYKRTGFVDPMAATFENKRIFLADFVLPSDPHIDGKTFINCEIVGPANIFVRNNNNITEQRYPVCDGVVLSPEKSFFNGIFMDNCTFRYCSFKRITLMVMPAMYEKSRDTDWLNWISTPETQLQLPGIDQPAPNQATENGSQQPQDIEEQQPQDIEEKKQS